MDDRRKTLELFSKQLSEGNPLAEEFVNTAKNPLSQSIQARDLAEDALANEVLKNTGVPIPGPKSSQLKQEDFLNRILQERYPELSPNVQIKDLAGNLGEYGQGNIDISKKIANDPIKSVSALLHEGGHQYDDKILKFGGTDNIAKKQLVQNVPEGRLLKDLDPMQMSEIINKGHHARIPKLRDADSFGLGALKSMLKSGTFKGIAPVVAKAGLATAGGLASLASEAADSEDEGSSTEQAALLREVDERKRRDTAMNVSSPEEKQVLSSIYDELDNGKTFDVRRDALKKLSGR